MKGRTIARASVVVLLAGLGGASADLVRAASPDVGTQAQRGPSAGLVAVITLNFGVFGAFGSYYAVEIVTAVIAWYVLSRYVMADRLRFEGAAPGESRSTRPGHRIGKELPQHA